jgi:hypothetical protein
MNVTGTADSNFCMVSGPDGLAIDERGNIWIASSTGPQSVVMVDSTGAQKGTISIGSGATNCCFGGTNFQTLFITAGNGVYSLNLKIKGRRTTGDLPTSVLRSQINRAGHASSGALSMSARVKGAHQSASSDRASSVMVTGQSLTRSSTSASASYVTRAK